MNGTHDNPHKRTSITELLNPVASSTPSAPFGASSYSSSQLAPLLSSPYVPPPRPQHVSPPPQGYPVGGAGNTFSLRAASWDSASESGLSTPRRQEVDGSPSSCRYGPSTSHAQQTNSHSAYPDQYQRARSVSETSNYGMDVPWSPASHESSPPAHYAPQMVSPMYSGDRNAISNGDPAQKNAPPSYSPPPQQVQYEQHELPPQSYIANGYIFVAPPPSYQSAERVSVRLAARGMPPQGILPQRIPSGFPPGHGMYLPHGVLGFVPLMMPPPPKRPLETGEEEPVAPKKRSRGKAKATDGEAKRSTGPKKRSGSTSQPPNASNGKGKGRESSKEVELPPTPALPSGPGPALHPELQFARCMSNRYRSEEFPRCVSCTRRWAGDTCRFQGIRFFLKDESRNIVGISFVENHKADGPSMNFPVKWNITLQLSHLERLKRTVARALLPVLKKEQDHIKHPEVIRRTRESEVRATCDTCMTSIFSSSWMCRLCGREACEECFAQVRELTTDRIGASEAEIAALQARREKHAHINPFFLSCTRRNEHRASDFSPMSRFSKDELDQAIIDMEALLEADRRNEEAKAAGSSASITAIVNSSDSASTGVPDRAGADLNGASGHGANGGDTLSPDSASVKIEASTSAGGLSALSATSSSPTKTPDTEMALQLNKASLESPQQPQPSPQAQPEPSTFSGGAVSSTSQALSGISTIPSHQVRRFVDGELTDEIFRSLWIRGEPIVVTGLSSKFRVEWSPEYFKHKYGSQSCLILECQTDQNKRVTVGEFFSWFGKYEGRRDCWKLKDWPPSTDFKTAFPELYEDFGQATPVPNYVRRDGVYNIASHFPSNTVAPDLGPKMYNAMASYEAENSKGSTRLHMDMADAINIMLFAASTPDGRPGCAAWDLFRSEDSPKLRKFLRRKFKGQYTNDPIHSQQFYLDARLRQELYDEYDVKSYRIYQKPGEAVFIPAGCAHQVCNLADCIKVASDFVSPENIDRCEMLTREFREQNQSMAWKEDVLQLRTMMWFAWLSCMRQEKEMTSAS